MFADDLRCFFNPDEFAVTALIQNNRILGILESLPSTIHQVQCCQFKFTCAQADIPNVKLDDEVRMDEKCYYILDIKPDGTGLVSLLLEAVA